MSPKYEILTGNEACALGALAAGMDFFAGYPITPATEIAEMASELLPQRGGKFIQMEDELASIAAVIGAVFAGGRAMTATSGPGASLMQENLGYAMLAEVPCVMVDVMRQGPCQGVATVPAQGDIMQARWGTHGDHPSITVAPGSVAEAYTETIRAFYLSEKFRTPVFILSDAMLAHMSEKIRIPEPEELPVIERIAPTGPQESYKPYALEDESSVPPLATFGDGYRWYVSGIIHDETGFPATNSPQQISDQNRHLQRKISNHLAEIESYEEYRTEDAELLIVSIGLVSRSVKAAIDAVRCQGLNVGLFRPITVWPFPEARLKQLAAGAQAVYSCEMNEGQLLQVVKQCVGADKPVGAITQNNGKIITAETIEAAILGVLK